MARDIYLVVCEKSCIQGIPTRWKVQGKCLDYRSLTQHLARGGKCCISLTCGELQQQPFPFPLLGREKAGSNFFFPLRPNEPKRVDWLIGLLEFRTGFTPQLSQLQFSTLEKIEQMCETYDSCAA